MSQLTPIQVMPGHPAFEDILSWPFPDRPCYVGQVKRLLNINIRQGVTFFGYYVFVYQDASGNTVGFGTFQPESQEYLELTQGVPHPYIPLLAVHPNFERRGHGTSILTHLFNEAVVWKAAFAVRGQAYSDQVFLDVYQANPARNLYVKNGFLICNPNTPIADPDENGELYFVMARNLT